MACSTPPSAPRPMPRVRTTPRRSDCSDGLGMSANASWAAAEPGLASEQDRRGAVGAGNLGDLIVVDDAVGHGHQAGSPSIGDKPQGRNDLAVSTEVLLGLRMQSGGESFELVGGDRRQPPSPILSSPGGRPGSGSAVSPGAR